MTILSNHRLHSYAASTVKHRSITPKKMPIQKLRRCHNRAPKNIDNLAWILSKLVGRENSMSVSSLVQSVSSMVHTPSYTTRTIYVWGMEYNVELPSGFDIYEGLRCWYPVLYNAVMDEENHLRSLTAMEEGRTEEEVEQAWARQDYLEWLYD
jgi:hypothetical protein